MDIFSMLRHVLRKLSRNILLIVKSIVVANRHSLFFECFLITLPRFSVYVSILINAMATFGRVMGKGRKS